MLKVEQIEVQVGTHLLSCQVEYNGKMQYQHMEISYLYVCIE